MTPATINDNSMKNSLAASFTMHLLFFAFLYFGLPVMFTPLPEHHMPVPFDIVEIADITNVNVKPPEPQIKPPEPPPPKPQEKPPVPQQTQQALPQPKEPPPPDISAEAIKPKPKPPVPKAKPRPDEFAKLLRNLEAHKNTDTPKSDTKEDAKTHTSETTTSQAPSLSNRLTISEEDAVRRQVEQCWSPPIGAKGAETMVVQVTGDISAEGIVQNAEVVDKLRMATDPFYRAMGESAIRALYNPQCTPLKLPADKYEEWKHFVFTFDPRDVL